MSADRARFACSCAAASLLAAPALLLSGACEQRAAGPQQRRYPYRIVTTVAMVTDIAAQVAGQKAEVQGLIPTGVDPHLYKPTRNDIAALQAADVVLYSGLMLEGKMAEVLRSAAAGGRPVHAVTELLDTKYLLPAPAAPGHFDPHVWMDVAAWSQAVEAVARVLSAYDPDQRAYYEENARRYRAELGELHAYVKQVIGSIPSRQRVLITAHDAFSYFGRAYDIEVRGIQGISTESEAGLEDINRLVAFIVARNIPALFVETSVADKNVRALVEGAAARGHQVKIGGMLFSDAMGKPGTYEGTYIGMLDHNATVIARALGGQAPPGGMQSRLSTRE